jgi:hypothetical protein
MGFLNFLKFRKKTKNKVTWFNPDVPKVFKIHSTAEPVTMACLDIIIKYVPLEEFRSKNFFKSEKMTTLFWLAQRYASEQGVVWDVNFEWDATYVYDGISGWYVYSFEANQVNVQNLILEALTSYLKENAKHIAKQYDKDVSYLSFVINLISFGQLQNDCHCSLNSRLSLYDYKSIVKAIEKNPKLVYYFGHVIQKYKENSPDQESQVSAYVSYLNNGFERLIKNHKTNSVEDYLYEREQNKKTYDNNGVKPLVNVVPPNKRPEVHVQHNLPKNPLSKSNEKRVTIINAPSTSKPFEAKQKASWDFLINALSSPISLTKLQENIVEILKKEFPWAEDVTRELDNKLSLIKFTKNSYFKLPPILLVGPPGCGKTYFAKRLAEIAGVHHLLVSCGSVSNGILLNGLEQTWANGDSNNLLKAIATWKEANPLFILDEIDKTADHKDGSFKDALLPFLEPSTAKSMLDNFLMTNVDYSYCNWIATANDISLLSSPLLSRFIVLKFPKPMREHTSIIANQTRIDLAKQLNVAPAELPEFNDFDIEKIKPKAGQIFSAREIRISSENLLSEKAKQSQNNLTLVSKT